MARIIRFLRHFAVIASVGLLTLQYQNCAGQSGFVVSENGAGDAIMSSIDLGSLDHHQHEEKAKDVTTFEPLLADRQYIRSLFNDIFGASAATVDSTRIYNDALMHGSACSLYEDYSTLSANGAKVRADSTRACAISIPAYLTATENPKVTVTRQALLTRACSDLVSNTATLNFALKRIDPSGTLPEPTSQNLLQLFRLFYRDKPDPQVGLIESLQFLFPEGRADRNVWAAAIFTVCASSYWQVL